MTKAVPSIFQTSSPVEVPSGEGRTVHLLDRKTKPIASKPPHIVPDLPPPPPVLSIPAPAPVASPVVEGATEQEPAPNMAYLGLPGRKLLQVRFTKSVFLALARQGGLPVLAPAGVETDAARLPLGSLWLAEQLPKAVKDRCMAQRSGLRAIMEQSSACPAHGKERQNYLFGDAAGFAINKHLRFEGEPSGLYLLRLPKNWQPPPPEDLAPSIAFASLFTRPHKALESFNSLQPGKSANLILFMGATQPSLQVGQLYMAATAPAHLAAGPGPIRTILKQFELTKQHGKAILAGRGGTLADIVFSGQPTIRLQERQGAAPMFILTPPPA